MTEEAQRIAIAEACGKSATRKTVFGETVPTNGWNLPDYLNDLNAMHEAEKMLTRQQMLTYQEDIWKVSHAPEFASWGYIHATAAQRAEAFLRTKGLWVE